MTKKLSKESKKMGAPFKPEDKRVDPVYHLYIWQSKRLKDEAAIRGISEAAMLRMGWDWFITALDTARDNGSVAKMFGDKFSKEVLSVNNKE